MKKMVFLMISFLCSFPAWADVGIDALLNKIILQMQAEQWVTTKTALVNVNINAAVTDQGIDKIQAEVMQKLNQLSDKGEWHVVSFNRRLDNSGLESIQIVAQARLPQSELANLRNKAKSMSKPGETFTIDTIQFTPSDDEIKQANITLRNNLYQQAKNEVDTLNTIYPDQKFYLHQIDFTYSAPVQPMPMMTSIQGTAFTKTAANPISVGNKLQLQAAVVIASLPDAASKFVTH